MKFNLSSTAAHRVDVMFLTDATGSMGTAIANVQADIVSAWERFKKAGKWDIEIGIAFYRDHPNKPVFKVLQTITRDENSIQSAANLLTPTGGGDRKEAQMYALTQLATPISNAGWRVGTTRIIAWFGDEPGHNPVTIDGKDYTENKAILELQHSNIRVAAFSMKAPGGGNHLNQVQPGHTYGQATKITSKTDGVNPIASTHVMENVEQKGVVSTIFKFIRDDIP